MTAAVQTVWAELIAGTLADAGVSTCVISPGSRSTPLVAALAQIARDNPRLHLVTIIDERAAAFYALGVARATGQPAALVCTSGTAAAHYLPAIVEASLAGVPLLAITADRPPELQACGASQTIDQIGLYGTHVRASYDLGAPVASAGGLRAVRRTMIQAITLALGPHPGPVHVEVPLRKPLEPSAPATPLERDLAELATELRRATLIAPPRLAPDPAALELLALAIGDEPHGVIVAGAMPVSFALARDAVFALATRTGYPVIAEAGSQLRLGPSPAGVVLVDHFDLIPTAELPAPKLVIQLGAEPVAAGWSTWLAREAPVRWVLAGHAWHDAESTARGVILGDVALTVGRLCETTHPRAPSPASNAWIAAWFDTEQRARAATDAALEAHPRNEGAVMRAAIAGTPATALLQIGNSLPIRVVDQVCSGDVLRPVITQRGAAGIDGMIASAAGATRAGQPVLLVLGDVSFAHDVGALLATRAVAAPLAILVIDNGGGQIFAGLPAARAELGAAFDTHWLTPPELDPAAVAAVFGARGVTALSPSEIQGAVEIALGSPGVTVIHAPVSVSGAHDVRRAAIELYNASAPSRRPRRTS